MKGARDGHKNRTVGPGEEGERLRKSIKFVRGRTKNLDKTGKAVVSRSLISSKATIRVSLSISKCSYTVPAKKKKPLDK